MRQLTLHDVISAIILMGLEYLYVATRLIHTPHGYKVSVFKSIVWLQIESQYTMAKKNPERISKPV